MGLIGPVPARLDGPTKTGLVELVGQAVEAAWSQRAACSYLEFEFDGLIWPRGDGGGLNRSSQHVTMMEVADGATTAVGG